MARLLRLLPIVIPLVQRALRNPWVRERLHLKPLDGNGGSTKRR